MAHASCHALLIDPDPTTEAQIQQLFAPESFAPESSAPESVSQKTNAADSFLLKLDAVATLEEGLRIQSRLNADSTEAEEPYDLLLLELSLFHEFSVQQSVQPNALRQNALRPKAQGMSSSGNSNPEHGGSIFNSGVEPEGKKPEGKSAVDLAGFALPIIVISQQEDEDLARQAINAGAYGYLLMPQLSLKDLQYTAWVAMQRHQQLQNLLQTTQLLTRDLEGWDQMTQQRSSSPRLTAQLFDAGALRDTLPDFFRELVEDYGQALDLALERRAYRVNTSEENLLRSLAEQLGFLKAGPRDVVDMHTQALRQKTQDVVPEKAQAYLSESRLTVLEVMGDLAAYYRRHCMGISQLKTYHRGDSS